MGDTLKLPLSNIQLELLKLCADNFSDEELAEVKALLVKWRFQKLREAAGKVWEEKGWTAEDMERLRSEHLRTPYRSQEDFLQKKTTN